MDQSARIEELKEALKAAINQIEYLHEKFQETGSGNGVLAQAKYILYKGELEKYQVVCDMENDWREFNEMRPEGVNDMVLFPKE